MIFLQKYILLIKVRTNISNILREEFWITHSYYQERDTRNITFLLLEI